MVFPCATTIKVLQPIVKNYFTPFFKNKIKNEFGNITIRKYKVIQYKNL